jgi:hypothetical protein
MTSEEQDQIKIGDWILTKKKHPELNPQFADQEFEVVGFQPVGEAAGIGASCWIDATKTSEKYKLNLPVQDAFNRRACVDPRYDGRVIVLLPLALIERRVWTAGTTRSQKPRDSDEPNPNNPFGWSDQKYRDMKFFGYGK